MPRGRSGKATLRVVLPLLLRNTEQEAVASMDGCGTRAATSEAANGARKATAGERGAAKGRRSDNGDVISAWG